MPASFNVRPDVREIRRYLKELGPGVNRAASRGINKTLTPVRAETARQIQQKRNLKIGVIKKALKVTRATYRRLVGSIHARGFPIPIRHFMTRAGQTRHGVSVKVGKKSRPIKLQKYGNKSFRHEHFAGGSPFVRRTPNRLPIEKWPPVPGIPRVFAQDQILAAMQRIASKVWPKRFREEIKHELRKAAAKARRGG